MVGQVYPTELQLNKANSSYTEAPFFDLNLSITNGIVSSKNYDKQDDFNFQIVNFPFLDGDVPRSPSYGVYIWGPQGFWGSGENGFLFSGSCGTLVILLGELGSKLIILEI